MTKLVQLPLDDYIALAKDSLELKYLLSCDVDEPDSILSRDSFAKESGADSWESLEPKEETCPHTVIDLAEPRTQDKDIYLSVKSRGFWKYTEDTPRLIKIYFPLELADEHAEAVRKAFRAQKIALMHSELSEALEADRKDLMDDKLTHRKGLEVELADAVIRIKDFAQGYDLDIEGAEKEKLAYNESRPYLHGENKKY